MIIRIRFGAAALAMALCLPLFPGPILAQTFTANDSARCTDLVDAGNYLAAKSPCQSAYADITGDQSSSIVPSSVAAFAALLRDAQTLRAYGLALGKTGDIADEGAFYAIARRYAYRVIRGPILSDPKLGGIRASAQALISEIEPQYDAFVSEYGASYTSCFGPAAIEPSTFVSPQDPRPEKTRVYVQALVHVDTTGAATSVHVFRRPSGDAALDAAVTRGAIATRYDVNTNCPGVPLNAAYAALFDPGWPADVVNERSQNPSVGSTQLPCDREATIPKPIAMAYPDDARSLKLGPVTVILRVDLDASGAVTQAVIAKSSGNASIDATGIAEARASGYAPALRGCKAAPGSFLFRAEFNPD